jgi:N-acetylmuramoyl-L-alanine amidase
MKKSNYNWLIDAGHGGMKNGVYTTAPAKMVVYPDGYTIFEGEVNRKVASKLAEKLFDHGIDFALVYDEIQDTSLSTRVDIINKIFAKDSRCISISIHSNASPDSSKPGRGFEVYTSPGKTNADLVSPFFCSACIRNFPEYPFRSDKSDGDMDKEAKFMMVTHPKCPSLLVESLFMDNREEAEFLNSDKGQQRIAEWLLQSILEVEKFKPI